MSTTNTTAVALSEAVVSLYPALASGQADYAAPVWLGATAQGGGWENTFGVRSRFPTGARAPKGVSGAQSLKLRFDRVWVRSSVAGQFDWQPGRGRHVLEVTWRDAGSGLWSRSRFHGVTMEGGSWSADGLYSFGTGQSFTATRIEALAGTGLLPEQVNLISVVSLVTDTAREVFRYDAGTGVYSEVHPGLAATLGITLSAAVMDLDGEVWLDTDGGLRLNRGITVGGPLPERRIDWRRGDRWLGSLGWRGLYVPASLQVAGPLSLPADGVAFSNGTVRATLRPGEGLRHTGVVLL